MELSDFPAKTPAPPYYAVVFTSKRTASEPDEYAKTADRMVALAKQRKGFLGVESVRDPGGQGITVSYWKDLASIRKWRDDLEHRQAQEAGKERWYEQYQLRISRVEHEYGWPRATD